MLLLLLLLLLLNDEYEKSNKTLCGSETKIGNNSGKKRRRSSHCSEWDWRAMITLFQKELIRNNPPFSSSPSSFSHTFLLGNGEGRLCMLVLFLAGFFLLWESSFISPYNCSSCKKRTVFPALEYHCNLKWEKVVWDKSFYVSLLISQHCHPFPCLGWLFQCLSTCFKHRDGGCRLLSLGVLSKGRSQSGSISWSPQKINIWATEKIAGKKEWIFKMDGKKH